MFYQDAATMNAIFPASLARIRKLLPSPRIHPIRAAPGRALVSITAHEFRASDIGPYNEVGVGFPFSLDHSRSPVSTWLGRRRGEQSLYVHQLPVTTAIARDLGVEFAGIRRSWRRSTSKAVTGGASALRRRERRS